MIIYIDLDMYAAYIERQRDNRERAIRGPWTCTRMPPLFCIANYWNCPMGF